MNKRINKVKSNVLHNISKKADKKNIIEIKSNLFYNILHTNTEKNTSRIILKEKKCVKDEKKFEKVDDVINT